MLIQCVQAIKEALYGPNAQQWLLPGVRVGILTFDRNVNFYNLSVSVQIVLFHTCMYLLIIYDYI
jgi:protein transport protein SEC24